MGGPRSVTTRRQHQKQRAVSNCLYSTVPSAARKLNSKRNVETNRRDEPSKRNGESLPGFIPWFIPWSPNLLAHSQLSKCTTNKTKQSAPLAEHERRTRSAMSNFAIFSLGYKKGVHPSLTRHLASFSTLSPLASATATTSHTAPKA